MASSLGTVETRFFSFGSVADPFVLSSGASLPGVTLAYETYGTLAPDASNAVLVFHALTGSQHAAGVNRHVPGIGGRWTEDNHGGWWDGLIGPGRAVDTDRWFVVCANYLGGCYGSTGPDSLHPGTGERWAGAFPAVTFADMVDAHIPLLEHLGISRLRAVMGGSTGGLMVLSLATRYPDLVDVVIPVASGPRVTDQQMISNFEQIAAVHGDSRFNGGDYHAGEPPAAGLSLARMIQHKTFVSVPALRDRIIPGLPDGDAGPGGYRLTDPLESYMWHQGRKFAHRFDANSLLRIIGAWQSFDLAADAGVDDLADVFTRCKQQQFLVFSVDSDGCFTPAEQEELLGYLDLADVAHTGVTIHSDRGHDSFLVEQRLYAEHIAGALDGG